MFAARRSETLEEVAAHRDASIFQVPVNLADEPDYAKEIKQPMDLSTIRKLLNAGRLPHLAELNAKLELMLNNALEYNPSDHPVYKQTQRLQTFVAKKIKVRNRAYLFEVFQMALGVLYFTFLGLAWVAVWVHLTRSHLTLPTGLFLFPLQSVQLLEEKELLEFCASESQRLSISADTLHAALAPPASAGLMGGASPSVSGASASSSSSSAAAAAAGAGVAAAGGRPLRNGKVVAEEEEGDDDAEPMADEEEAEVEEEDEDDQPLEIIKKPVGDKNLKRKGAFSFSCSLVMLDSRMCALDVYMMFLVFVSLSCSVCCVFFNVAPHSRHSLEKGQRRRCRRRAAGQKGQAERAAVAGRVARGVAGARRRQGRRGLGALGAQQEQVNAPGERKGEPAFTIALCI